MVYFVISKWFFNNFCLTLCERMVLRDYCMISYSFLNGCVCDGMIFDDLVRF